MFMQCITLKFFESDQCIQLISREHRFREENNINWFDINYSNDLAMYFAPVCRNVVFS